MNLRKQAVTTKCRDNINAEPSRVFEKAVEFRASKIIGHRWGYRPQIGTD